MKWFDLEPLPRVWWRALSVYDYDPGLRATVRHVYGYRGDCTCGHDFPVRRTVHAVRADIRQHKAGHDEGGK